MINVKPVQQTRSGKKKRKQDKQKSRASTNKAPIITKKKINESNLPKKRQRFSEWVFKKGKLKKNPAML